MPKEQVLRYTDDELLLIKNAFADNDALLKAVRKMFLQLPLREEEKTAINSFKDKKDLIGAIRKFFLIEIDGDAPLNQVSDWWFSLLLVDKTPEEAMPHILARKMVRKYLWQQLDVLEGGKENLKFADFSITDDAEESYVNLLVHNSLIQHIEQQLMNIKFFASLKNETPEEAIEGLKRDSNK